MLSDISYSASGNPLQTLDLWLPSCISGPEPVLFVIYIHGGAWTDPLQTKTEGYALLDYISSKVQCSETLKLACASVNYRLSSTSGVSDIRHPVHMNDIIEAVNFLKRNYDLQKCILVGHSAGATLAVQIFHHFRREILSMVLFNGIYDLVALVEEYPEYNSFISAAFGELDKRYILLIGRYYTNLNSDWRSASPSYIIETTDIKPVHLHELVVLAHSHDDELLSMQQTDMFEQVMNAAWGEKVHRAEIYGKHDDSPQSIELQNILNMVIDRVSKKIGTI